jgi:hypothetical protein
VEEEGGGGGGKENRAHLLDMRSSLYRGRGQNIGASLDTEINPWMQIANIVSRVYNNFHFKTTYLLFLLIYSNGNKNLHQYHGLLVCDAMQLQR